MRIGDLADATGVSRRLLRYYEDQGLLTPERSANGYREYTAADIAKVRNIRALLAVGLPTATIAGLLHCVHEDADARPVPSACPVMLTKLRRRRAEIAATIDELRDTQQALDAMLTAALRTSASPWPQ